MRHSAWILCASLCLFGGAAAAADASLPSSDDAGWARWQGRLSLGTNSALWQNSVDTSSARLAGATVMGDYYFSRSLSAPGQFGGLRATSGLIMGARGAWTPGAPVPSGIETWSIDSRTLGTRNVPYGADLASDYAAQPYVGVGYTGSSLRSGWALSADLGLVAQSAGAVRLGRMFTGGQSLDEAIRDMRLAPVLQFAVSYSF